MTHYSRPFGLLISATGIQRSDPVSCVYNLASLARSMIADPRIAVTETDWDNLLKATDNPAGCKFLLSARVAIRLRVLRTVSEYPPNVSKARGVNWIPTSLQFWAYCSYFLSSAADSAKPLFSDALIMGLDCKGEVTITSKVAVWPAFHTGKKISTGLELLSGSKLFWSEMGDQKSSRASWYNFFSYTIMTRDHITATMARHRMVAHYI